MTAWNDIDYGNAQQTVTPFDPAQVNPASYDLRLGDQLRRVHPLWTTMTIEDMRSLCYGGELPYGTARTLTADEWLTYTAAGCTIDALPKWGAVETFTTAWLMPGEFVLCSSLEVVTVPDDAIALLFSKSSTGRNGLEHLHAGLGDPGFSGTWTWELHNVAPWPIKLTAGQRLMQHVFLRLTAAAQRTYATTGRYQHQHGPTPAREARRPSSNPPPACSSTPTFTGTRLPSLPPSPPNVTPPCSGWRHWKNNCRR